MNSNRRRRNPNNSLRNTANSNNSNTNHLLPQVPAFERSTSTVAPSITDSALARQMDMIRLNDNQSQLSGTSDTLALLINLDEIIGDMSSMQTTPNVSRIATPAFSETDPGTEIEVRFEDLDNYDIQGVNWNAFSVSREDYRVIRMREYRDFESRHRNDLDIFPTEDDLNRIKTTSPLGPMLSFRYMNKVDACNIPHFQLRHLLCCPTIRSVIFPHYMRIKSWNPISNQSEIILNTGEFGPSFSKASVLASTESHLFVGGYSGEIITKSLESFDSYPRLKNYSTDPSCITNHISIIPGANRILISCNDMTLRSMDVETGKVRNLARFPYAVNAAEASLERTVVACVGDSRKVRLLDFKSNAEVAALEGHSDFCFSLSWSPCGRYLASGSQDRSARIFDIRMLNRSLHTLVANMAPVRRVTFSPCGSLFAMMEADDFVHLFDVKSDFRESQTVDFFGEIAGISFDPDGRNLYIACAGTENGGIMEFSNLFSSN